MTNKTTEALKLAEEAAEFARNMCLGMNWSTDLPDEALAAIREALAEQPLLEPEGRCKECMAYNDHLDYCSKAKPVKQEPVAWDLAEKVRRDLDRQSCPGVYMNIAVESIVKNYAAAIRGMK